MTSYSCLALSQRERQTRVNQLKNIRSQFIKHLQLSQMTEVDLDNYVLIAHDLFSEANVPYSNFSALPSNLVDIAECLKYGLPHDRVQARQIASMMLNIRDGVASQPEGSLPVKCPSCGQFCQLTQSHHRTRKSKFVYYCDECDYSVRAFAGDFWPTGVPASLELRKQRGSLKLGIDRVASECGVSSRTIRFKMASMIGLPVGVVASEGQICNDESLCLYKKALEDVRLRYVATAA